MQNLWRRHHIHSIHRMCADVTALGRALAGCCRVTCGARQARRSNRLWKAATPPVCVQTHVIQSGRPIVVEGLHDNHMHWFSHSSKCTSVCVRLIIYQAISSFPAVHLSLQESLPGISRDCSPAVCVCVCHFLLHHCLLSNPTGTKYSQIKVKSKRNDIFCAVQSNSTNI